MNLIEFYNTYFLINLIDYPNIGIDLQINVVLFCFLIGLIITTVIFNLRTETNITLIKKLLRYESINEESAKTLDELQLNNLLTRYSLSAAGGRLAKIILRFGSEKKDSESKTEIDSENVSKENKAEAKIDFSTAKFYISPEKSEEAKRLAETNTSSALNTVLYCILMIAFYVFIMFLMPSILELINNFLA